MLLVGVIFAVLANFADFLFLCGTFCKEGRCGIGCSRSVAFSPELDALLPASTVARFLAANLAAVSSNATLSAARHIFVAAAIVIVINFAESVWSSKKLNLKDNEIDDDDEIDAKRERIHDACGPSSMSCKRSPCKSETGASRDGDMTATNKEMRHDVSTSARLEPTRVLLVPWIPGGTKVLLRNEATRRFSQNAFFVPPSIGRHARIDGGSKVPQSAISFVLPSKSWHARIEVTRKLPKARFLTLLPPKVGARALRKPGGPQYAI